MHDSSQSLVVLLDDSDEGTPSAASKQLTPITKGRLPISPLDSIFDSDTSILEEASPTKRDPMLAHRVLGSDASYIETPLISRHHHINLDLSPLEVHSTIKHGQQIPLSASPLAAQERRHRQFNITLSDQSHSPVTSRNTLPKSSRSQSTDDFISLSDSSDDDTPAEPQKSIDSQEPASNHQKPTLNRRDAKFFKSDFDMDKNAPLPNISDCSLNVKQPTANQKRSRSKAKSDGKNDAAEAKRQRKEERERKKAQKEEEAKKAKAFRIANKLKLNKNETMQELIIHAEESLMNSNIGTDLRAACEMKNVGLCSFTSTIPHVIIWKRRIQATYDEARDVFIPLPSEQIVEERMVMCVLDAEEFATLVMEENVEVHMKRIQSIYPNYRLIYMFQGIQSYFKKKKRKAKQNFEKSVRAGMEQAGIELPAAASRKRKNPATDLASDGPSCEAIEDKLLWLQVIGKCLIVHTKDAEETAEWILILTGDISAKPYKSRLTKGLSFADRAVKSGKDAGDTWEKMLQEVRGVTPSVANSIRAEYSSIRALFDGYANCGSTAQMEQMLAGVEITNQFTVAKERNVNRPTSKRIFQLFTSMDPTLQFM